jgi:uncharacterized protein YndB with AHSA1/START domain
VSGCCRANGWPRDRRTPAESGVTAISVLKTTGFTDNKSTSVVIWGLTCELEESERRQTNDHDIYIGAPVSKVWKGLVDGDITKQYVFGTRFVGPLKKGAPYAYVGDGDFTVVDGEILEIEPEKWLAMSWKTHWDASVAKDRASRVIYEVQAAGWRNASPAVRQQTTRHLCRPPAGSLESEG